MCRFCCPYHGSYPGFRGPCLGCCKLCQPRACYRRPTLREQSIRNPCQCQYFCIRTLCVYHRPCYWAIGVRCSGFPCVYRDHDQICDQIDRDHVFRHNRGEFRYGSHGSLYRTPEDCPLYPFLRCILQMHQWRRTVGRGLHRPLRGLATAGTLPKFRTF